MSRKRGALVLSTLLVVAVALVVGELGARTAAATPVYAFPWPDYSVIPVLFVPTDWDVDGVEVQAEAAALRHAFTEPGPAGIQVYFPRPDVLDGKALRFNDLVVVQANGPKEDYGIKWNGGNIYTDGVEIVGNLEHQVVSELYARGFPTPPGQDIGGYSTVVFVKGAGGYAGARQYPVGGGVAILGDWAIDSIQGAVPAGAYWWSGRSQQMGATVHELGHTLGLPHPDAYGYPYESTVMGDWWLYPDIGMNDWERAYLDEHDARWLTPVAPSILPGGAATTEGSGGTSVLQIPVSLSAPSGQAVTSSWTTLDYTAVAPGDFVAASGTVTFAAGQTTKTVAVTINGDTLDEPDELMLVSFTNPTNATIGGFYGLGFGIITDDDPLPTIVPGAASIAEGSGGTSVLQIPVSLSAPSGQAVTASWTTLNYTAVAPGDFVAASGTVTFGAGQTTKTVAVTINGDTLDEPNELLVVSFTNPVNATIGGFYGLGFGTITDDDPQPTILPGQTHLIEGNLGTNVMAVPVSLSVPSGQTVTAWWTTLDYTAVAPGDFVAASGTVTFAPGETTKLVLVDVNGDTLEEPPELLLVSFTNPTNATIGGFYGLGFGYVVDDD